MSNFFKSLEASYFHSSLYSSNYKLHHAFAGKSLKPAVDSYPEFFGVLLLLSVLVTLNFYLGLFNQHRWSSKFVWLINYIVAAIAFFIYSNFKIQHAIALAKLPTSLAFNFNLTSVIYFTCLYIILSIILKYFSSSNSKIPF